uniref:DNA replication licensing factor MCM5 n=2 Tax=Macrostomum lignano TaxID=282301 RepID=A0A1I8IR79_9PLAT
MKRHCNLGQYYVTVHLQHLASYSPEMSQTLAQQPTEIMPIFEEAAREIADEITRPRPGNEEQMPPMQVLLSSHAKPVAMRDLKADLVCRLVRLTGIVLSVSSVRAKATQLSLQCRSCRACLSNLPVRPGLEGYALPRKCITDAAAQGRPKCPLDPFFIVPDRCHCVDFQLVKLQEAPEAVPHGETPRHLQVYLDRYQCDRIAPGNRVSIVGVYSVRGQAPKGSGNLGGPGVRATYVRALGIALEESSHGIGGAPSDEEEEEFRRLAAKPDIQERLARSIAPSILGSVDVKKAICCLLFGGSRKRMPDGLYRRGDINVLLLGDPGTAKSQLLKFVEKCAPIAVYTSGKGSSAAGLTASVIRDPSSRGFVMEGGAMVLADGGVVAIDEFDKMREDDRVAIHEAMEQQTISTRAAGENIDFMPTILSRFDMIFIVKDEHSEARDTEMARHVLQVHLRGSVFGAAAEAAAAGGAPAVSEDEVPLDKLRRYISFCRDRCGPRLSEAAAARLENAYVAMRG